jgi:hypothetical protein
MATDVGTQEPSVTSLVTDIVHDAEELFKQQFQLLKTEVREDVRKSTEVGVSLMLGAGLALVGGILLMQLPVHLLNWLVPQLPLWACFGIWGAIAFACGAVLVYVAKTTLDSFNPLVKEPETLKALKENVEAITNPK